MTAIKWTNAMSVGVERLDRDHQMLIEMINRIASADDSEATRRRVIPEVLVMLIAYTVFHFQREEKVMQAMAYPETEIHREEHWTLTREVHLLQRRFSQRPDSISREEVLTFLTEWLNHHILLQDMAYKPYCEGREEAQQAAISHGEFDLAKLLNPASAAGEASGPAAAE